MSHHVYTTDAFVIDSLPSGEANKSFFLFTRELGMIRATAQGVRLLKSKLRFSLQDFSHVSLSVVRGKDIWRVTNAKVSENLFEVYKNRQEIIKVIAQVFALLKRLMPGEEKHEELFQVLVLALDFLKKNTSDSFSLTQEEISSFEAMLVLNILNELGYLADVPEFQKFINLTAKEWNRELVDDMTPIRKIAYREINKSLKETQL